MFWKCFVLISLQALLVLSFGDLSNWGPKTLTMQPGPAKKYSINLEDDYYTRWAKIITENKQILLEVVHVAKQLYAPIGQNISDAAIQAYDSEYYAELKAVAQLLGVPINDILWVNVMYEAYSFCTSIVVQDQNDRVFHGRNLDYSITLLAKVAFDIDYYRGGKVLFRAQVLGGFIGFITAEKPGKFSISANQRTSRDVRTSHLYDRLLGRGINLLEMFWNKRHGILMVIRNVLETAESYDEAVSMLSKTPLISPAYYIVSGVKPNEGIVLTMGREKVEDIAKLDTQKGVWYLVQTNTDRDLKDPDHRRTMGEQRVAAMGRDGITEQKLLDGVLALYPNFNAITMLSVVYAARNDYWNTTVWM